MFNFINNPKKLCGTSSNSKSFLLLFIIFDLLLLSAAPEFDESFVVFLLLLDDEFSEGFNLIDIFSFLQGLFILFVSLLRIIFSILDFCLSVEFSPFLSSYFLEIFNYI